MGGNSRKMSDFEIMLSIIMPIYNTENYIERSVRSVLKQSYKNYELILIDDGSDDRSWEICQQMIKMDGRIVSYKQKHLGVSAARNLGLKKSKGKYIFFLDSDDEYRENLLQKVVNIFEHSECDCIRFQSEHVKEKSASQLCLDEDEEPKLYSQKDLIIKAFSNSDIYCNLTSACFGAYKREIIENSDLSFKEEFAIGEDGIFVMEYLLKSHEIVYMQDVLYTYYDFDPEKRVSTMAPQIKVAYDTYEFYFIIDNMVYQRYRNIFTIEEKKVIYFKFYDQIIGSLVRFAAYSQHMRWKQIVESLTVLLDSDLLKEAEKYYRTTRKTDSRLIPYFMKKKRLILLWLALRNRSRQYYSIYGKKKYIVSIYKNCNSIEYQYKNFFQKVIEKVKK